MASLIGKTISHYKILEKLGEGGMGIIYRAEDLRHKRTVALKVLPESFTRDQEFKQRFIVEAQNAPSLQHNNICTIHEIDATPGGQLFISMDYYEGEALKSQVISSFSPVFSTLKIGLFLWRHINTAVQSAYHGCAGASSGDMRRGGECCS